MSTPDINETPELNDDDLNIMSTFRPWNNVIRGRRTCTANLYDMQHQLIDENQDPISRKDIVKSLQDRNLLRQMNVIQISSSLKSISIQFETSLIMETFCTEPLQVREFTVTFHPDFRKNTKRYMETEVISFLNVPLEADEEAMTQFYVADAPALPTFTSYKDS